MLVDTIFYPPLICVPDLEKSQNIIFSSWGRKNIQNDATQPIWALEHPKCIFQLKGPKCPWSKPSQNKILCIFISNPSFSESLINLTKFDPKSISSGPKNPNFDPVVKTWLRPIPLQRLSNSHSNDYSWVGIRVRTVEMSQKSG